VTEKREVGNPRTVIIHVRTNDMRKTSNLTFVMEELYELFVYGKEEASDLQTCPEWSVEM